MTEIEGSSHEQVDGSRFLTYRQSSEESSFAIIAGLYGLLSVYDAPADWVFANDRGQPRWQETILQCQLKPAALRAGIGKIGWHTFRHTYSTMLRSAGTDIKVQQELVRHANIQIAMNVYTQAVSDQKRAANSKIVEMVLPDARIVPKQRVLTNGSETGVSCDLSQLRQTASSE